MSSVVIVHKHRNNRVTCNVGRDVTASTITCEIRSQPFHDAPIVATWVVSKPNGGGDGLLLLLMNEAVSADITVEKGFMDLKEMIAGEPWAIFDAPLEVSIRDTITA